MAVKIAGSTKGNHMGVSWLKTGEESAKLAEAEKAAAAKRKAEQGKLLRFYLKKETEAKLVFVDGDLSSNGYLTPPRFYEHFVNFNGEWQNIVCPQQTNPSHGEKCPICEGKDRPALVSLFTVIDLRPFTTKDGKVIAFSKKLLVAKPMSFELLNKIAVKRGGLTGCVFDVSRVGDKSPAIGDVFDFVEKLAIEDAMLKFTISYKTKDGVEKNVCLFEPANYATEVVYRTGDDLRKMGFGAPVSSVPFNQGSAEASGEDFKEHL